MTYTRPLIALALSAALCAPLGAGPVAAETLTQAQRSERCASVGMLAEVIMTGRQQGVSLAASLEAVGDDSSISALARAMVLEAFSRPRYQTRPVQQNEIADFRDRMHLICLQGA
jgi:hypothetical protein